MEYEGNNMVTGIGIGSGAKIERGALDELRETASKALACVTEIRGSAAVTADRLIGERPEKTSESDCQPDPYSGKIGSLSSVIHSLVREAEAALAEVRRFNKL